jgi:hypothetical protein
MRLSVLTTEKTIAKDFFDKTVKKKVYLFAYLHKTKMIESGDKKNVF